MEGKQTYKNLRFYWVKSALPGGIRCFLEGGQNRSPHGEEAAAGRRLEPWSRPMPLPVAILRDGASRLLRMRAVGWARSGVARDLFELQANRFDDRTPAGDLVGDEACRLFRARIDIGLEAGGDEGLLEVAVRHRGAGCLRDLLDDGARRARGREQPDEILRHHAGEAGI